MQGVNIDKCRIVSTVYFPQTNIRRSSGAILAKHN